MYCSKCGQAIGIQAQCPGCGAPTGLVTPMAGMPPLPPSRLARHLHTLGVLWIAFSIYSALTWLLFLPVFHIAMDGASPWVPGSNAWMYSPFHPGGWLLHFITILVFARAVLALAVGIALLTRQPWGRIFAIIVAILTLVKPLLGTVLAIYTLGVLLSRNANLEYDRIVVADRGAQL